MILKTCQYLPQVSDVAHGPLVKKCISFCFVGLYHNNEDFGNCKKVTWNEFGNGMFFEDFEFPISIVTNKNETDYLINNVSIIF